MSIESEGNQDSYKAVLIGGTGLAGSGVLHGLLKSKRCSKVLFITRRKVEVIDKKMELLIWKDFDKVLLFEDEVPDIQEFEGYDLIICTLGLRMKGKTTEEAYTKVNKTFPVNCGRIGKSKGVDYYYYMSNAEAKIDSCWFHARTKAETEEELEKIGFKGLGIIRSAAIKKKPSITSDIIGTVLNPVMNIVEPGFKRLEGTWTILQEQFGVGVVRHFEERFGTEFGVADVTPKMTKTLAKEAGGDGKLEEEEEEDSDI